jgi:hydrogenase maturation protease
MERLTNKILIVGIGSEHRHDDTVGIEVARELEKFDLPEVTIVIHTKDRIPEIDAWLQARAVILIDSVCSDHLPGTVHRFDLGTDDLPEDYFTHSIQANSVVAALRTASLRSTTLPPVVLYGIDGIDFGVGGGFTAAVKNAIPDVLIQILQDILTIRQPHTDVNGASLSVNGLTPLSP